LTGTLVSRIHRHRGVAEPVDLWTRDLDAAERELLDVSVLDADEHERAARFSHAIDRHRYLAAHVATRQILASSLDVAPGAVTYARETCGSCGAPHGRPEVRHGARPLYFSASRRDGRLVVAVARIPVGADIEAFASPETVADVSRLLHEDERRDLRAASPEDRPSVFSTIWARKEAYAKCRGDGLSDDLLTTYVGTRRRRSPPGWSLAHSMGVTGYVSAVAAETRRGLRIRFR
jgi:4'-phosphopantetheinyl transferase